MRITLDSHIHFKNQFLSKGLKRFLDKNLRFINPDYVGAAKMAKNKWAAQYIPKYIYGYAEIGEEVFINRGFWSKLSKWFKNHNVHIIVNDQTLSVPVQLGFRNVPMREYQQRACRVALKRSGGIIKMPCGAGKTRTMLEVIARLNQSTLILVHTNFLLNQWKEYLKDLYNYEPGIIQGDKVDIKSITIAMIQTLYSRKLTSKFLNRWGCLVIDETHHVPATSFDEIVNQFPAKYRYGLSATLHRTDGLSKLIFADVGKLIYTISAKELAELGYLQIPDVYIRPTDFYYSGAYPKMMKNLIRDDERNELIIETLSNNLDRFNLVLSDRIEHLEILSKMFAEYSDDYEVIIGKVKTNVRNDIIKRMKAGELHTIFATTLADEGLDIPNLDAIYLAFPTKSDIRIEQRIGRIQRIYENKPVPIVYDFDDELVPRLAKFTAHRENKYEDLELNVHSERKIYRPSFY